jgi:hypothetical protein
MESLLEIRSGIAFGRPQGDRDYRQPIAQVDGPEVGGRAPLGATDQHRVRVIHRLNSPNSGRRCRDDLPTPENDPRVAEERSEEMTETAENGPLFSFHPNALILLL